MKFLAGLFILSSLATAYDVNTRSAIGPTGDDDSNSDDIPVFEETTVERVFQEWYLKHEKDYQNAQIQCSNSLNRTFTLGLNKFADLTNEDFYELWNDCLNMIFDLFMNDDISDLEETTVEQVFQEWYMKHEKNYQNALEYRYRFSIFSYNYAEIQRRNSLNRTFTLGLNKFADLTNEEFRASHHSGVYQKSDSKYHNTNHNIHVRALPEEVDWTLKGAVTPVKNQGQCGSCWAFSSTGSIEGAWFLATGHLISLSEQQLVDCSTPEGNQGCNGGIMDQAFEYVIKNGGICSEAEYPYIAQDGNCTLCKPVAKIHSYIDVQPNNDTALMVAVAQQPVSVAVEADGLDWQFYFGGVVTDSCGTNLDHGVLVVGYGNDTQAGPYWKVKNSWGQTWGENGYIRLGRGAKFDPNGECGILMQPSYPVVV